MSDSFEYGHTFTDLDTSLELSKKLEVIASEEKVETSPPKKMKPREPSSTRDQFNGTTTPIQLKIDSELIQSLKLHALSSGKSMSEIVMECLTSKDMIKRAWITVRQQAS